MSTRTRSLSFARLMLILTLMSAVLVRNSVPAHAATKLLLWHAWKDADAALLDSWIAAFQASHSDITITAQYIPIDDLRNKFETAVPPDFIIGSQAWGGILSTEGLITPLDDRIDQKLKAQLPDPIWASARFNGKIIGIPINTDSLALYYNNTLADPKNLPENLDNLLDLSKDLTKGDNAGLIMTLDFYPTAG